MADTDPWLDEARSHATTPAEVSGMTSAMEVAFYLICLVAIALLLWSLTNAVFPILDNGQVEKGPRFDDIGRIVAFLLAVVLDIAIFRWSKKKSAEGNTVATWIYVAVVTITLVVGLLLIAMLWFLLNFKLDICNPRC